MLSDSPGKTVKQVLVDDFSRVSPGGRRADLRARRRSAPSRGRQAARRGARPPAQGAGRGEGHGAVRDARSCPSARRCSSRGSSAASQRRVLRVDHAPAEGLPRQSVRGRGRRWPTAAICRSTSRPTSCASPTACRCSTSPRRARSARASTRSTGQLRAAAAQGQPARRRRWRSSCTWPASGCRSRARPRRPSPTTTSCSRR